MKLWSKFFVSLLAVAAMAGCNKHTESFDKDLDFVDDGEPVFLSVNMQLPVGMPGTRTATGETTDEPGQSFENTVQTVLLVLAEDETDKYIAHKLTGRIASAGGKLTVTSPIDKTSLGRYYTNNRVAGESGDEMTLAPGKNLIRVYAYCNPPQDLLKDFSKMGELAQKDTESNNSWLDFACEIGQISPSDSRTETEKEEGSVDGGNQSVWASHSFLMSNTSIYKGVLPLKYSEWEEYSTAANPFVIKKTSDTDYPTPIPVERAVARFDFKDGSPKETPANTYDVTTTGAASGKLQVQLVRMSLVNMSRHFYYLKHVTEGSGYETPVVVCQPERIDNWVVDTDWKETHKAANRDENFKLELAELKKFYNFCLFDIETGGITEETRKAWNNHRIENVLKQQPIGDDYHIWRYVTENTIPNVLHQTNGISTGIVFKGKLLAEKSGPDAVNKDLLDAINGEYVMNKDPETGKPIGYVSLLDARDADGNPILEADGTVKKIPYPILYMFNDVLYVGWNHQIRPILNDPANNGTPLVEAATMEYADGKSAHDLYQDLVKIHNGDMAGDVQEALTKFRKAATQAGFTLYQASDDLTQGDDKGYGPGYYFYYYYWNRHNDNGRSGTMGKMEFGVVRNNIYKLSVKSIKNLGHPRISDNDPEKPTPETPNEDAKVYLEVAVEVRPWTVRVNEIDF